MCKLNFSLNHGQTGLQANREKWRNSRAWTVTFSKDLKLVQLYSYMCLPWQQFCFGANVCTLASDLHKQLNLELEITSVSSNPTKFLSTVFVFTERDLNWSPIFSSLCRFWPTNISSIYNFLDWVEHLWTIKLFLKSRASTIIIHPTSRRSWLIFNNGFQLLQAGKMSTTMISRACSVMNRKTLLHSKN